MKLPLPRLDSQFSLEKAINNRRSIRGYADIPVTLADISQLLWAAQGILEPASTRTVPSAGATYPLDLFMVAGKVEAIPPGLYEYANRSHDIVLVTEGDYRQALSKAALGQTIIEDAPLSLLFTANYERTTRRYGERGIRYVQMEAGHAAQNVYLQATALGLGTVVVGAFDEAAIIRVLRLPAAARPLYIMPVGKLVQETQFE